MRPVLAIDLLCAGRALMSHAPDRHADIADDLVAEADIADWYRQTMGEPHPAFGDGTLAAAARARPETGAADLCDPQYCRALIHVLEALIAKAKRH